MRIEEYGINVNATFHDIRKQGYKTPVNYTFLLGGFEGSIPNLPLVRGHFSFSKHKVFEATCTVGFKSGIYFSSPPKVTRMSHMKVPPPFIFTRTAIAPVHGAIGFANKSEYVAFLQALVVYVAGVDITPPKMNI